MTKPDQGTGKHKSLHKPDEIAIHDRRAVLRKVLAASGVIAGVHFIPSGWVKPVIEKVVLPAHAQTSIVLPSCSTVVNSSPRTVTAVSIDGSASDVDGIEILFDGCNNLTMSNRDDPSGSADRLLFLDCDADEPDSFDIEEATASNWQMFYHSWSGGEEPSDLPAGGYSFSVQRRNGILAGRTFDVSFTVSLRGFSIAGQDAVEMTVQGLQSVRR